MDKNLGNEVVEAEGFGISENMLPEIISGQVKEIQRLEVSIKNAVERAEAARTLALSAKEKSAGLFQKKEAIELLQSATISLAEAESATVEAQTVSFECQKKIGEITKYLFALGCTNMAANRSVVRELKMILEGASGDRLDELAKQEIINVVRQLKAQEDIANKQNELSRTVREQKDELEAQKEIAEKTRNELVLYGKSTEKELMQLFEKNSELSERLTATERALLRLKAITAVSVISAFSSAAALVIAIISLFI